MRIKAPCKDCPNRSATCHAGCAIWAEYVKKRDQEYEDREAFRRGMYSRNDRMAVNEKYKFIMRSGKDIKTW